jgi:hypothetical protein
MPSFAEKVPADFREDGSPSKKTIAIRSSESDTRRESVVSAARLDALRLKPADTDGRPA